MIMMRNVGVLLALCLMCGPSLGKGGRLYSEDRYNPQHINDLPPEVRKSVLQKCSDPKALHSFASYLGNPRRIVLHFEDFVCDGDGTYCTSSGCLHEVWVFSAGRYQLLRSYYAPAGD